jgi:8-oxo-dGTP diphosphatase
VNVHDPASSVPPRLSSRRDPGDAWVESSTGEKYWGRYGAAGLLVHAPERGVLLQHRAVWSHHGGTWGVPGGALHQGESPSDGALREANEEAGVPADAVVPFATDVLDRGIWAYTTVLARTTRPFEPYAGDAESLDLQWVAVDDVAALALHPAFAAAWPRLRAMLSVNPVVVIDAANVIGARPNGWWRDRLAATDAFAAELGQWATAGAPAGVLDLPGDRWTVAIELVVEGAARDTAPAPGVTIAMAHGSGDDHLVERVEALTAEGRFVTVVTSDRALGQRATQRGATVHGASWLLAMLSETQE